MNKEILAAKQGTVSEIVESMKSAQSVSIVEYRGLTVTALEELRRNLRKENSSFKVYKNTLVALAAKELGYSGVEDHLQGPNAFIFSNGDEVSAPKVLAKFAKAHEEVVFKGGIVSGKVVSGDELKAIAKLPNKNGLLSMFLSCLQSPVTKFAATVKAVADGKQA